MAEFIELYNYQRYHEGIGNVTPADGDFGRWEEIRKRSEEQRQETLDRGCQYNLSQAPKQTRGELGSEIQLGKRPEKSQRC
jgi:hypothetical protein